MKRIFLAAIVLSLFGGAAFAEGGLSGFLQNLNLQAQTDGKNFAYKLAAQFGVPQARVDAVITNVKEPADAFMCLQVGEWTGQAPEEVVKTYQANKGKAWGELAQSMGIKPGSAEFHALKKGDLKFSGKPVIKEGKGKGKGEGKRERKRKIVRFWT